ncbi:molybdopterin converting factor, subunit 1 [Thermaerobacter marianensis DSM 12885]|uniref:Molybdopterin converting factor, subunit 1 n=1 Tax=Thermaerobacter marianensis (strain ATCC 700841 / DSM 12885 / JCM 10246 / 7p75a) TaxID=644966 RepID=E6SJL1_THEM7|nr:molybdenum cofactor biosynthesis protein MoaE [Thermaerobacter marianensis]ADU52166.1 molybdopterin converting factor, subunit 1 [Thermaerobacter marianensis DSM 12885]
MAEPLHSTAASATGRDRAPQAGACAELRPESRTGGWQEGSAGAGGIPRRGQPPGQPPVAGARAGAGTGPEAAVCVSVRLFAVVADRLGTRRLELALPPGARAGTVRDELARRHPGHRPLLDLCRLAVNGRYADPDTPLAGGDEVALIPPVSGGGPAAGEEPPALQAPASQPPASQPPVTTSPVPPRVAAGEDGRFFVTVEPLSLDELFRLSARPAHGAVVLFVGITRRFTGARETERLEYEAYLPMAAEELARIGQEAEARWPGVRLAIGHRTGPVAIGEASVVVAAAAPHRPDAFAAARYAIDELKVRAPVWKREHYADGRVEWVGVGTGPENPSPAAGAPDED